MVERDRSATLCLLAAGIAHEINNPLDGLQHCLRRILNAPTNTAQVERYGRLMTAALAHIEKVVRQLRHLSPTRELTVRVLSVNDVLRDAVELAQAGRRWGNVEVDWRLSSDLPLIRADSHAMAQVFLNLLLNAADAMPDGGRLTVAADMRPSGRGEEGTYDVVIEITDSGRGIPPEAAPHVFEPFFTTKASGGGSGLGLAVARGLVLEHGGRIEFESVPEAGTTFRVTLPGFIPSHRLAWRQTGPGAETACA